MAASISISFCTVSRHSLTSFRSLHVPPEPQFLRSTSFVRSPSTRVYASMSIEAPEKAPKLTFLDHKESGFLYFVKYHGLGNDFILVDNRDSLDPRVTPEQAVKLCDRNFGIGADGVIFALPGINGTDYSMRIFNSDGSEPEMCGNGVRCFARFVAELENFSGIKSFTIHTGAGLIVPEIQTDGKVRVDMGQPILRAPDIPTKLLANKDGAVIGADLVVDGMTWNVTCVSMGNPHCVTFSSKTCQVHQYIKLENKSCIEGCVVVSNDSAILRIRNGLFSCKRKKVDDLSLADIGPKFEHHEMFPSRTNTEFVQFLSRSHLKMRVWERGAGATLACGTGACAVVVAAVLEGRSERNCMVDLPGGPLEIEWREEDNHVYMTGPAEVVFYGSVPLLF